MRSIDTTKLDRKSGGSRGTCCAPFPNATAQGSHLHTKPDSFANLDSSEPGRTRMLIGNRSKTNPILFETNAVRYNQRISCTPSPIYSLIWTALILSRPFGTGSDTP
jgi:hypothetical protein